MKVTLPVWWEQAACAGSYDLRFCGTEDQQSAAWTEYCKDCSVTEECRHAGEDADAVGLWGGHRRKIR